jgi:hypothetical protein
MAEPGDYKINYEPLFGPLQLIDVGEAAFSVPRGMLHRPVALEPTQVLMIEETGVAVTGD